MRTRSRRALPPDMRAQTLATYDIAEGQVSCRLDARSLVAACLADPRLLLAPFAIVAETPELSLAPSLKIAHRDLGRYGGDLLHNLGGSREAGRFFYRMLDAAGAAEAIEALFRTGILESLVPELAEIRGIRVGQHKYEALEHTIWLVRHLRRDSGAVAPLLEGINKADFHLALLFHDLGKTSSIDEHTGVSADKAAHILDRWGLSAATKATVLRLIRQHSLLGEAVAGIIDVDDIARQVATVADLNHLYAFTLLDMRSVDQRGSALAERAHDFERIYDEMRTRLAVGRPVPLEQRLAQRRGKLIRLNRGEADAIHRAFASMRSEYLLTRADSDIMADVAYWRAVAEHPERAVVRSRPFDGDRFQLDLFVPFTDHLFPTVAGILADERINVLSARSFVTLAGNATLFLVHGTTEKGEVELPEETRLHVETMLTAAAESPTRRAEYARSGVPWAHVYALGVRTDPADDSLVLTLRAANRVGLLYQVSRGFSQLDLEVVEARVQTRGHEAEDEFRLRRGDDAPDGTALRVPKPFSHYQRGFAAALARDLARLDSEPAAAGSVGNAARESPRARQGRWAATDRELRKAHVLVWFHHAQGHSGTEMIWEYSGVFDGLVRALVEAAARENPSQREPIALGLKAYGRGELLPSTAPFIAWVTPDGSEPGRCSRWSVPEVLNAVWPPVRQLTIALDELEKAVADSPLDVFGARVITGAAEDTEAVLGRIRETLQRLAPAIVPRLARRLAAQGELFESAGYFENLNPLYGPGGLRDIADANAIAALAADSKDANLLEVIRDTAHRRFFHRLMRERVYQLQEAANAPSALVPLPRAGLPSLAAALNIRSKLGSARAAELLVQQLLDRQEQTALCCRALGQRHADGSEACDQLLPQYEQRGLLGLLDEIGRISGAGRPAFDPCVLAAMREPPSRDAGVADEVAERLARGLITADCVRFLESLRRMRIIDAVVPEWRKIRGLLILRRHYTYPTDVHTTLAFAELRHLQATHGADDAIAGALAGHDPVALSAALLLHDLGRGSERSHAAAGAEIARRVAGRLGLGGETSERVVWLVRHHLLLRYLALRKDVRSPAVQREVVQKLGNVTMLDTLYLMTLADGTAQRPPGLSPLTRRALDILYSGARRQLTGDAAPAHAGDDGRALVEAAIADLQACGFSAAQAHRMAERLTAQGSYPVWIDATDMAAHAVLLEIATQENGDSAHQEERQSLEQAARRLGVLAFETATRRIHYCRSGSTALPTLALVLPSPVFFAPLAAALSLQGTQIEAAFILPAAAERSMVLFALRVGGATAAQGLGHRLLSEYLELLELPYPELMRRLTPARATEREFPSDGAEGDARAQHDSDSDPNTTVLEVQAADRIGLLARLSATLEARGLAIVWSRILTEGDRVVDVFGVQRQGGPVRDEAELAQLESELVAAARLPGLG
ncbi:MAG: HD domain-containing protein [Candidatus Schekmanbacteria bacterium]|nr:HD domain-containing protein [Candidatus Schekmanbacteria bacterium]